MHCNMYLGTYSKDPDLAQSGKLTGIFESESSLHTQIFTSLLHFDQTPKTFFFPIPSHTFPRATTITTTPTPTPIQVHTSRPLFLAQFVPYNSDYQGRYTCPGSPHFPNLNSLLCTPAATSQKLNNRESLPFLARCPTIKPHCHL